MKTRTHTYLVGCFLLIAVVVFVCVLMNPDCVSVKENEELYPVPTTTEATLTGPTQPEEETKLLDYPMTFPEIQYRHPVLKADSITDMSHLELAIEALEDACSSGMYTPEVLVIMEEELLRLKLIFEEISLDIGKFEHWEDEYPYATEVWYFLRAEGFSEVAAAGILGNLMAECGGHTLNLDPLLYDKATGNYYGMFQWSTKYYPDAEGLGFEDQLLYFKKTVGPIFDTFGKNYYKGFTLDAFNELTSPRDAALAFAKVYERCSSFTYERRQNFSEVAYKYFVTDFKEVG